MHCSHLSLDLAGKEEEDSDILRTCLLATMARSVLTGAFASLAVVEGLWWGSRRPWLKSRTSTKIDGNILGKCAMKTQYQHTAPSSVLVWLLVSVVAQNKRMSVRSHMCMCVFLRSLEQGALACQLHTKPQCCCCELSSGVLLSLPLGKSVDCRACKPSAINCLLTDRTTNEPYR